MENPIFGDRTEARIKSGRLLLAHFQSDHLTGFQIKVRQGVLGPHIRGKSTIASASLIEIPESEHKILQSALGNGEDHLIILSQRMGSVAATWYGHVAVSRLQDRHRCLEAGTAGIKGGFDEISIPVFHA